MVAFLFGSLALVNGMLHVKHIADQGATGSDVTGHSPPPPALC